MHIMTMLLDFSLHLYWILCNTNIPMEFFNYSIWYVAFRIFSTLIELLILLTDHIIIIIIKVMLRVNYA